MVMIYYYKALPALNGLSITLDDVEYSMGGLQHESNVHSNVSCLYVAAQQLSFSTHRFAHMILDLIVLVPTTVSLDDIILSLWTASDWNSHCP